MDRVSGPASEDFYAMLTLTRVSTEEALNDWGDRMTRPIDISLPLPFTTSRADSMSPWIQWPWRPCMGPHNLDSHSPSPSSCHHLNCQLQRTLWEFPSSPGCISPSWYFYPTPALMLASVYTKEACIVNFKNFIFSWCLSIAQAMSTLPRAQVH